MTPDAVPDALPRDPKEIQALVDQLGWFHTIDLGNGVRTKGVGVGSPEEDLFPPVEGRSVLDIGAWDGRYSYMAERKGASRVVALDHYVWGVDMLARGEYWAECRAKGELPDHTRDTTDFWRPTLPGRRGFDLAHRILDSKVEPVVGDFMEIDLDQLGTFDVVFYLGVLYHMKEPLTALERLRKVTGEMAVIETEAMHVLGHRTSPLLDFRANDDFGFDFGNWYVPTLNALYELCRAAGFRRMETVVGPPTPKQVARWRAQELAAEVRKKDGRRSLRPKTVDHYRAMVRAYV